MTAIALTIAGSDSGGGAGIQADLKSFSALGVYGCSVVTAITAQNTRGVTAVHEIPTDIVVAQINAVLEDIDVAAVKIGMLGTSQLIAGVAEALTGFNGPVVLDPVMIAKSGAALLPQAAIADLRDKLIPRASVLTPNIPEAARLLDQPECYDSEGLKKQGYALLSLGAKAVLMKGGHGRDAACTDWLISADGERCFTAPRIDTTNTHGTGCSLSSAIAAGLARGKAIESAVERAHGWLHEAIRQADKLNVGHGHGPVHHFHEVWE